MKNTRWTRAGEVVLQSGRDLLTDNAPQLAAAVAYYALLSSFPLFIAGASLLSFAVEPTRAVHQAVDLLDPVLPMGEHRIEQVVIQTLSRRGTAGLFATLVLLFAGTRVFGTLTQALNTAFDVDEVYGFWRRRLSELLMLLSVGFMFLLALLLPFIFDLAGGRLSFIQAQNVPLSWMITGVAPVLLLLVAFFLLYRHGPRRRPRWKAALPGAILATSLFLIARVLFLAYIQNIAEYDLIYGSLSVVVIVVLWAWIAALVLLFGGEIVTHAELMLIEGRSADEPAERHQDRTPKHRRK